MSNQIYDFLTSKLYKSGIENSYICTKIRAIFLPIGNAKTPKIGKFWLQFSPVFAMLYFTRRKTLIFLKNTL